MHGSPDGPWFFIIARSLAEQGQFQLVGVTDTAMLQASFAANGPEHRKRLEATVPGGVLVKPEEIGETAVVIALAAAHRRQLFDALHYAIDRIKQIVPIWKKEHWADGAELKSEL